MDWNLQFVLPRVKLLLGRQAQALAKLIPGLHKAETLTDHPRVIHIRPARVAGVGVALPDLVHGRAGGVVDTQRGAEKILMQNRLHDFRLALHGPRVGEHHLRHAEREHLPVKIGNQPYPERGAHLEIPEDQRAAGLAKIGSLLGRDTRNQLGLEPSIDIASASASGVSAIIWDSAPESHRANLERRQVIPPAHLEIHRHRAGGPQAACHHDGGHAIGLRSNKRTGGKTELTGLVAADDDRGRPQLADRQTAGRVHQRQVNRLIPLKVGVVGDIDREGLCANIPISPCQGAACAGEIVCVG